MEKAKMKTLHHPIPVSRMSTMGRARGSLNLTSEKKLKGSFSVLPSTTTEIITVPVVEQEVQIQSGKWEQPTIVYQQHSYFITDQM